jgi:four helix bundle protein
MADFKNLVVWQKGHALTIATIEAVEDIKGNAGSIVRTQLIRSMLSVGSNIAEGSAKRSDREFARFVRIALGSATESENHFLVLKDLLLISQETFDTLAKKLEEVCKMLSGLEQRLAADAS